jgi:ribosome biogenesis GTPase
MTAPHPLVEFGWNDTVAESLPPAGDAQVPGRVIRVDRGEVDVAVDATEVVRATMSSAAKDCVAGDWVIVDTESSRVVAVAPRRTAFVRRAARGARAPQTLAANMDIVGVCQGLVPGVNLRRLERELVLAHQSGAVPVVILTKADLVGPDEVEAARSAVSVVAGDVEVVVTSSARGDGLDGLRALLAPGVSFALLGASGVGKSALVNALAGKDVMTVGEIRGGDGKGRHTTTSARLLRMADGSLLLDTPGVRALALWDAWDGLAATFPEIARLESQCQFADCFHDDEPGCAVVAADAAVSGDRLESWRRLRDEMMDLDDAITEQTRQRSRTGRPEA